MPKTKPIGVRFDQDILDKIKLEQNLKTPQAVLSFLMDSYHPHTVTPHPVSSHPFKMPSGMSLEQRIQWLEEHG